MLGQLTFSAAIKTASVVSPSSLELGNFHTVGLVLVWEWIFVNIIKVF